VQRACTILALFLSFQGLGAGPVQLGLDSTWEWQGKLGVLGCIDRDRCQFFWSCRDCAGALRSPGPGALTLGFSCLWVRAGPLAPAGLLREANNPLGFTPQSDVFFERTGLPLDRSLDATRSCLLLMPIPGSLGLYAVPSTIGTPSYGCFASILARNGCCIEGFLSVTRPDADDARDDWFDPTPPFPGGQLLVAGTRTRMSCPWFSCTATVVTSQGERVPPGSFAEVRVSAFARDEYVTLLLGGLNGAYRNPRGAACREASLFAGAAGITRPFGSLRFQYGLRIDKPDFAPHPFRADRQSIEASFERTIVHEAGFDASFRLKAEKRIDRDAAGAAEDTACCTVAVRGGGSAFDLAAGVDIFQPDGMALFLDAALLQRGAGPRLGLDSRWESRDGHKQELSEVLTCRLARKGSTVSVAAGIERLPLAARIPAATKYVKLSISWSAAAELPDAVTGKCAGDVAARAPAARAPARVP
jgi:hypothetical protein